MLYFFDIFGKNTLKVVDPVMGDNGMIYSTYNDKMCNKISYLVNNADIITPNVTEAAILLGYDYTKTPDTAEIKIWLEKLCAMGPEIAVITGYRNNGLIGNIAYSKIRNTYAYANSPEIDINISGTGDLFASLFTGYILKGFNLETALEKCNHFIFKSLKETKNNNNSSNERLIFENQLKYI